MGTMCGWAWESRWKMRSPLISTIGERSVVPNGITVGKNAVIFGVTTGLDYEGSCLPGGKTLIKAGEEQ